MDASTIEDLQFYAETMNDIERYSDAFGIMRKMIERQGSLSKQMQMLFASICKSVIDPDRRALELLRERAEDEEDSARAQRMREARAKVYSELLCFGERVIGIISDKLLPGAAGGDAVVLYQKLRGDVARYIVECASGEVQEKYMRIAEESYLAALEAAEGLEILNPLRLGTVLNFSVFKYEHMNDCDGAIDLMKVTLNETKEVLEKLDDMDGDDIPFDIIDVMKRNLCNWIQDTFEEEEECKENKS